MKILQSKIFVLESKENVLQSKIFAMDRLNMSVHFYFAKIVTFFVPISLKEYNSKKKVIFKNSVSRICKLFCPKLLKGIKKVYKKFTFKYYLDKNRSRQYYNEALPRSL